MSLRTIPSSHIDSTTILGGSRTITGSSLGAALIVLVSFGVVGEFLGFLVGGVLIGLATLVVWYVGGTPFSIATGMIGLLFVFPTRIDPFSLALVTVAFGILVLSPLTRFSGWHRVSGITLGVAIGIGGLGWIALKYESLVLASILIIGALALVSYTIHRVELVTLGLVTDERSASQPDGPASRHSPTEDVADSSGREDLTPQERTNIETRVTNK